MAGNRVINTVLSLKDNFTNTIKNIASSTEKWENELEKSSKSLENMKNTASTVFKGIGAGVLGLGATFGISAAAFSDYDKASRQLVASTGEIGDRAEMLKDTLKDVYADNFGESWDDVASAVSTVNKLIGGTKEELKTSTENAFAFRDTFGVDIQESIRSAKTLMDQFGITNTQAFNLLTQGEQQGLDYSGELLDSINEYSVQFKKFGFNAEDMFNIFNDGAIDGAFNLDKIGDAVKEFSIRAIDGSKTTTDGFTKLGMNADDMAKKFANGGDSAKEAFIQVTQAIANMKDPVQQSIVGVDLFGTMWEDLGPKVVTQLGNIGDNFNANYDSMSKLNDIKYTSFSSGLDGIKRQIETAIIPLGESMVPYMNDFANWFNDVGVPKIKGFADYIGTSFPESIQKFKDSLDTIMPILITVASAFAAFTIITKVVAIIGMVSKAFAFIKTIGFAISAFAGGAASLGEAMALIMGPVGWITLAIVGLVAGVTLLYQQCQPFRDFVNQLFSQIVGWIQGTLLPAIAGLGEKFLNLWNTVLVPFGMWIASQLAPIFQTVFPIIGQIVTDVFGAIGGIISGALQVFGGLIDFITGVFSGNWSLAWQGIVDIFGGIFSGLGSLLKVPLNVVIGLINAAISAINSNLQFDVPDWVPSIGGQHIGANIPQIPTLYKGTDYFKGGPALVGERGPEIVNMESGSTVATASETQKALGEKSVNVYVTVQGNVIGNEDFANYVGRHIVNEVKLALGNM